MPHAALELATQDAREVGADTLAVFATKEGDRAVLTAEAATLADEAGMDVAGALEAIGFEAEVGAVTRVPTAGALPAKLLLVVGLGETGKVTLETVRRAAGAAARNALKDAALAVVVPTGLSVGNGGSSLAQAVAEGAGLGAYAFTRYRTKPHDVPSLDRIVVVQADGDAREGVARGEIAVRATCLARDLVNEPPGNKRPPALAEQIADLAKAAGLKVKVSDEAALAKGGFGGLLAVGQGSSEPPRLVELTYEPSRAEGHVVLVGKGITFDSGGLSLKPTQSMSTMKSDMSGAAAVVAAMTVLGELGVRKKVTGMVALAENMPSGSATRVSDVLTHRGGKTVEVMNTDAEGRLVLADALAYGTELTPDAMIDLATLTGAQVVALGTQISALMGTDDVLMDELERAAEEAGERLWRLPLPEDYADQLKSPVADLKNIGKPGQAGTIIGGLFLKEFVGATPWAHLDIAGPAFSDEGDGWYTPKGGTGVGVRTLLAYLAPR